MSIKPILFNTDMVRAILDGRKTVTRRVVKPQPKDNQTYKLGYCIAGDKKDINKFGFGSNECGGTITWAKPPCWSGDIIYVRETWGNWNYDDPDCWAAYYQYRADYPDGAKTYMYDEENECDLPKWHPSIHMPKEAARIWLKVTNVRVERLQDITREQAEREGACDYTSTADGFADIWDSTVKKEDFKSYGWQANPWVWVIEFERCEKPQEENNNG